MGIPQKNKWRRGFTLAEDILVALARLKPTLDKQLTVEVSMQIGRPRATMHENPRTENDWVATKEQKWIGKVFLEVEGRAVIRCMAQIQSPAKGKGWWGMIG